MCSRLQAEVIMTGFLEQQTDKPVQQSLRARHNEIRFTGSYDRSD